MIEFIKALSFWEWYWIVVVIMSIMYIGIVWYEGELTARLVFVALTTTFIPGINMVAVVIFIFALGGAAMDSDKDIVLWERQPKRNSD